MRMARICPHVSAGLSSGRGKERRSHCQGRAELTLVWSWHTPKLAGELKPDESLPEPWGRENAKETSSLHRKWETSPHKEAVPSGHKG